MATEAGPGESVPLVSVDQVEGARLATQHLLELGHRTVWHIPGPSDWLEAQDRVDGWRSTLEAAGAAPPPVLVGDWSARAGHELGRELAGNPRSPPSSSPTTRWRSASCARCTRRAAGVPADISVVGFDDIPEAEYFTPPLTTVRQNFNEMGRRSLHPAARADRERQPRAGPRDGAARADRPGEHDFGRRELRVTDSPPDPSPPPTDVSANALRHRRRLRHPVGPRRGRSRSRRRGARLGRARVRPRGDRLGAAGDAAPSCRRTGRCRTRTTTSTCCATPSRPRVAAAGVDPRDVVGIATDFTASTPLPALARRDAAVPSRLPGPPARLPEAVEAPRRPGAGGPRSTRVAEERGEPWLARYGGRISSEWEFAKALQVLEEDPEIYDRDGALDRGGRLDRLAAVRRARRATSCSAGYKAHLPGRRAIPSEDYLRALDERFAGLRRAKLDGPLVAARRARRRR